ncbi:MAG: polyheme membrane-associated cytochrome C [Rhodospirillales bacterium]|nr:polyheme membrane-associated cytochrome C [Rhodospirillales bacterium]
MVLVSWPTEAQSPPLEIPFVKEWAASPHAQITGEPFNHWNEEGEVPAACARCHTTPGFLDYIGADGTEPGSDGPAPVGTVITCIACHNKVTMAMTSVTFPSGVTVENAGDDSRCMTCHQGRESTDSVNKKLAGKAIDTPDPKIGFINIHYRAAGATRYGNQVRGGYQYAGKDYKGFYTHDKDYARCADCHEQHTVKVKVAECKSCHKKEGIKVKKDLQKIRKSKVDFDGNGNLKEGIYHEIDTMHKALLGAIQAYADKVAGGKIAYDGHKYPYFFNDKNGNGKADRPEAIFPNQYRKWTPRLLRAAYNYQFVAKDPGVYAHNPEYVIQLMHDSLADLSTKAPVDISKLVRPKP